MKAVILTGGLGTRISEETSTRPKPMIQTILWHIMKTYSAHGVNELVENFDLFDSLKHSSTTPRAYTVKGLNMLATIPKSQQALQARISIIEIFSKIRELSRNINELSSIKNKVGQGSLMKKVVN